MKAISICCAMAAAMLCAGTVAAQTKAKAQNVPEIPYDSVPNFIKMPPGLYLGETMGVATNSKGHFYVFTRSANTRLFEFDQTGTFVREIGEGNYGFEFAHSVRVDPEDNIWAVDEGTNMVIKFNPAGKVAMVLGHRPDAVAGMLATTVEAGAARSEISFRAPDRRGVGSAGKYLCIRRLCEQQSREVRQERTVSRAGGKREGGNGPKRAHAAARNRGGCERRRLCCGPVQSPAAGVFDNNLRVQGIVQRQTSGTPGPFGVSPGPHQYLLYSRTLNPNVANGPGTWDITGEIYKDGTGWEDCLGRSGHASKQPGGFQVVHMMD